jgi:hypothetical protein
MLDQHTTREALGWLRDLSNPPDTDPRTSAGREWLARLDVEMTDANASGGELVAVARDFARKGGFFPTPGQIVESIRERRMRALHEERQREPLRIEREELAARPAMSDDRRLAFNLEWNVARNELMDGDFVPAGWTAGFATREDVWGAGYDIHRRGHRGTYSGESIAAALDRERREWRECVSRGEEWNPPTYGKRRPEYAQ